jgi:hypothetical protein
LNEPPLAKQSAASPSYNAHRNVAGEGPENQGAGASEDDCTQQLADVFGQSILVLCRL